MINYIMKKKSSEELTKLLKIMALDKKYRNNINYIRKKRAVYYFKWAAKKNKIKIKAKSKFSTLIAVAALLKLNQSTK